MAMTAPSSSCLSEVPIRLRTTTAARRPPTWRPKAGTAPPLNCSRHALLSFHLAFAALAASLQARGQAGANPATAIEAPSVHIVGIRPVPGLGTALRAIPSAVQSTNRTELAQGQPLDVPQHLGRPVSGVPAAD